MARIGFPLDALGLSSLGVLRRRNDARLVADAGDAQHHPHPHRLEDEQLDRQTHVALHGGENVLGYVIYNSLGKSKRGDEGVEDVAVGERDEEAEEHGDDEGDAG